jgi:hypothetical protein
MPGLAAGALHEKTRTLARELLNDWDTFWVVLDYPELPLAEEQRRLCRVLGYAACGRAAGFAPRSRIMCVRGIVPSTLRSGNNARSA